MWLHFSFSLPHFLHLSPVKVFILFRVLSVYPSFIPPFLVLHASAAAAPPAQVKAGDRGAFSMQMSGFESGAYVRRQRRSPRQSAVQLWSAPDPAVNH